MLFQIKSCDTDVIFKADVLNMADNGLVFRESPDGRRESCMIIARKFPHRWCGTLNKAAVIKPVSFSNVLSIATFASELLTE